MIRKIIYKILSNYIFPNKGVTHIKRSPQLIISLTTYPRRKHVVVKVIDTLLRQSIKPDAVILWLYKGEWPHGLKSLPYRLRRMQKFGLQIRWCDENLRSYKKIIPALIEFPNDIIVTADDDILYSEDWLEKLYTSYMVHPTEIHGHHAYSYTLNRNHHLNYPNVYKKSGNLDGMIILGSGGGVLLPPNSLHHDVTNKDLFIQLAPTNDDFWLWAMARLQGTPIRLVDNYMGNIVCVNGTQDDGLWQNINAGGAGSEQFCNIVNKYPQLQSLIQFN